MTLKWSLSCITVTEQRAVVRVVLRMTGSTAAEVARATGSTENSPTLAVKGLKEGSGCPRNGWESLVPCHWW